MNPFLQPLSRQIRPKRLIRLLIHWMVCAFVLNGAAVAAGGTLSPVHHDLVIAFDAVSGEARIRDQVTLHPGGMAAASLVFALHRNFRLEPVEIPHTGEWAVLVTEDNLGGTPVHQIEVKKPAGAPWPDFLQLKFKYAGPYRGLPPAATGAAAEARDAPGNFETLFLSGESYFYPVLTMEEEAPLLTFSLETVTPPGWTVVSPGKRTGQTQGAGRGVTFWQSDDPTPEVVLTADRYHESQTTLDLVTVYVFLKQNDPALAKRYLDAAKCYLTFYEKLLGPYPFVKFAIVENSAQTGWGLPSFTLLGSRVIRFPFILHTSLPHEILHNWWGNGVYVDAQTGNWSEGLTTYLADHLFPEIQGQGPRYRFQQLMKYLNYVTEETDFPIAEFQSRTSMASQAIGYGKWLMVVHMLRRTVGDAAFLKSLREFFRLHLFKKASFQDLRKVFERVTGRDLRPFFDQWVRRTGAPVLQLTEAVVVQGKEGAQELEIQITQKQHGPLFVLDVPIALWDEDSGPARVETVRLKERDQVFRFPVSSAPRAVMLDPWYDLFRRLDRREAPPSLGQTYGAERAAVLVSREEPSPMTAAYRQFGAGLGHPILEEAKVSAENLSLWVLGRSHPMARLLIPWLREKAVQMQDGGITIEGQTYDLKTHSVVLTVPHPDHPARAITWLMANTPAALRGLLRKLPHYGKYGFLVFAGDAPSNVAKGVWPAARIGLMRRFHSGPLPLPARPPLVPFAPTP